MSKPTLMFTEFHNATGHVSWGFRIYDDYYQSYDNNLTKQEYEQGCSDNMVALAIFLDFVSGYGSNDNVREMMDYVVETESGITINDEWYDWEEINTIFNRHYS